LLPVGGKSSRAGCMLLIVGVIEHC
jgi:hypothetical protein